MATTYIRYNFQIQKRIVSIETIWGLEIRYLMKLILNDLTHILCTNCQQLDCKADAPKIGPHRYFTTYDFILPKRCHFSSLQTLSISLTYLLRGRGEKRNLPAAVPPTFSLFYCYKTEQTTVVACWLFLTSVLHTSNFQVFSLEGSAKKK